MAAELPPERIAADRRALWQQVLSLGLVGRPEVLEATIVERRAEADRLLRDLVIPGVGDDFGAQLAAPATPGVRLARHELARMASSTAALARGLHDLHAPGGDLAEPTARAAIWLALSAAVVDQKVDDGELDPDEVRQRLNPAAFLAALAPGAPPIGIPSQPFLERLLANTTAEMGARIASGASEWGRAIVAELERCITEMIAGQLDSPRLLMGPGSDFAEVELTLQRVNALTVWIWAYLGLLGNPRPGPDTVRAVRQITTRIGEIGWALDALSDIHADLAAGVWNLVWLELARATGPKAPWLREHHRAPERALDALARADITTKVLVRIGLAIEEIERTPNVTPAAAAQLAAFCRYMVWAFLVVAEQP